MSARAILFSAQTGSDAADALTIAVQWFNTLLYAGHEVGAVHQSRCSDICHPDFNKLLYAAHEGGAVHQSRCSNTCHPASNSLLNAGHEGGALH